MQFDRKIEMEIAALSHAHGITLALIAAILEKEGVIASRELAQSLAGLANVTAVDQPEIAEIVSLWATFIRETSLARHESPPIQ